MNTIQEDFKRDLEVYYKNIKAAKSIISLKRYSNRDNCKDDWVTLDVLMEDIINSLSDYDVRFGYSGKINRLNDKLEYLREEIEDKYTDLTDDFELPSRSYHLYDEDNDYNVANMLSEIARKGGPRERIVEWSREFLSSCFSTYMDLGTKVEFLVDLVASGPFGLYELVNYEDAPSMLPYSKDKQYKLYHLVKYMKEEPWVNSYLVEKLGTELLTSCNYYHHMDFSSPTSVKKAIKLYEEGRENSDNIYQMMQSPNYKDNTTLEEKTEDILNILKMQDIRRIDWKTKFLLLECDPEVFLIIAGLIRDNWNSIEDNESLRDYFYERFVYKRTATNRDEYRKQMVCAKKFLEIVNDAQTRDANEAKNRYEAQNKLIKVLSKTLEKTQNNTIGNINKKDDSEEYYG